MNTLNSLILKHCPDGVSFVELDALLRYEQPTAYIVKSEDYDNSFKIPVLTAGASFILGYTDEDDGLYTASEENPVIIFDDFTTSFHWVDFHFKVKSSAMKMITIRDGTTALLRYIYHAMKNIFYKPTEHARQWIGIYSKFKIPLPPIEVQREIVRILDKFTTLEAELEAELEARKKQYMHYRRAAIKMCEVWSFEKANSEPGIIKYDNLGNLAEINRGVRITKSKLIDEGEYSVISGGINPMGRFEKCNREANTITIAQYGTAGYINWQHKPFWANDVCYTIHPSPLVNNRYLYHVLKDKQDLVYSLKIDAIPAHLPKTSLENIEIPLPSLSEQQAIADSMDMFENLINGISCDIPAEIEARRKQYEYYRNKLLTFEESES